MKTSNNPQFNRYYDLHCKHLKLKGLQPKTIDAYTRAIRRIGDYFDFQMDDLSHDQLLDYFHARLERLSWSAVKLDLVWIKVFLYPCPEQILGRHCADQVATHETYSRYYFAG